MRFAGTWKQYSAKAISQLTTITSSSGLSLKRRWPYHAIVMKVLEQKSKMTVSMGAIVGEVSARVHKFSRHIRTRACAREIIRFARDDTRTKKPRQRIGRVGLFAKGSGSGTLPEAGVPPLRRLRSG